MNSPSYSSHRWLALFAGPVLAVAAAFAMVSCNSGGSAPSVAINPVPKEEPLGPPLFEDVTAKTGINFTYRNGEEAEHMAIIESLGGGVGLIDFDRDGRLDI